MRATTTESRLAAFFCRRVSRSHPRALSGDLWQFWYDELPAGTVRFNVSVDDLGTDPLRPTIGGEVFDLAVIADGGWSALRAKYFDDRAPQYAGYQVWRFRVPAAAVPGFRAFGDYSDGTHHQTILLDVAMNNGEDWIMGGSSIAVPESEVTRPATGGGTNRQTGAAESSDPSPPPWYLPWYKERFGALARGELYRCMAAAAEHGKIASMPQYEFAARRVVSGRRVLVGDAAHMASPRTASGAHTAVLDAAGLLNAFAPLMAGGAASPGGWGAVVDAALAAYGPPALQRAAALYARSLEVSADVVPPGWKRSSRDREL